MNKLLDLVTDVTIGYFERSFYDTHNFMMRPIGLLSKSYDFLYNNLTRNIGNVEFEYGFDGYGTQIGEVADPFYNTISQTPWFISDNDKNSYSNYIDYIKAVYGATLSVENINNDFKDVINDIEATRVASIGTDTIINGKGTLNPNNGFTDTKLGELGYLNSKKALSTSIAYNYESVGNITQTLYSFYGLKTDSIKNDLFNHFSKAKSSEGKNTLSNNFNLYAPSLENPGIGNTNILYDNFINSLGTDNMDAYLSNISENYYSSLNEYMADNVGFETNVDEQKVRYIFSTLKEHSTISDDFGGLKVYSEKGYDGNVPYLNASFNSGTRFSTYSTFLNNLTNDDLLRKTNDNFRNGRYRTILAKFHTDVDESDNNYLLQTAVSRFGMSHGRNLLKENNGEVDITDENGYDNPYCRVWTYHHQYKSLEDAIRPFMENGKIVSQDDLYWNKGFHQFSSDNTLKGFENGRARLGKYGVLNKNNGLVNISPIDNGLENEKVDIKNCMFSIENLAWKDSFTGTSPYNIETISKEQKGPFGGRIMWFPPYDLSFNEDVSVNWAETNFIGRGESIYTYKNTRRTGTLSFKLLIDHPSIINYWTNAKKDDDGTVDDVESGEQELLRFFAGCDFLTPRVPEKVKIEEAISDDVKTSPNTITYTFFIFFPNNYSGVDDDPDYAIDYLANGYGTWMTESESYKKTSEIVKAVYSENKKNIGGYEMRPSISLDYPNDESIYGSSGIGIVQYGEGEETLFAPMKNNGQDFRYYYRVDKKYLDSPLTGGTSNYFDLAKDSSTLNSTLGITYVLSEFSDNIDNLFSFSDFYVALKKGNTNEVLKNGKTTLYNESYVNRIENEILGRKDKISSIICTGSASKPGSDNNSLSLNRAKTVKEWLSSFNLCDKGNIISKVSDATEQGGDDDINSVQSKLFRNVRIDINIDSEEYDSAQNLVREASNNNNGNMLVSGVADSWNVHTFDNLNRNLNYTTMSGVQAETNYEDYANNLINKNLSSYPSTTKMKPKIGLEAPKFDVNIPGSRFIDAEQQYNLNSMEIQPTNELERDEKYELDENLADVRYDNEARFFELLKINEPFLHNKISEKIKYFDPAFHSVSPEGFNARLTFLQQCCRQGPTASGSDSGTANGTANNLSFGRPPVCILRIGDFYYTKIIVDGVTIDYNNNGLQWDLNQEGIGVMPMIANVTMRFTFIGGSSLSGPISRLQNALSFNMYANTEVYDNRAELAEFDDNGNTIRLAPFNPSV